MNSMCQVISGKGKATRDSSMLITILTQFSFERIHALPVSSHLDEKAGEREGWYASGSNFFMLEEKNM